MTCAAASLRLHRRDRRWAVVFAALLPMVPMVVMSPARASDLGVSPVIIHLTQPTDRITLQVRNRGSEAVIVQAETVAWRRVNGVDEDTPTRDLIVNPSVFRVEPQQTQVLRIGLRHPNAPPVESTYRLVLQEVPPAATTSSTASTGGQVRVLLAMRLPVYVAPSEVKRSAQWQARTDHAGNVTASVINSGNVHLRVVRLRLHDGSDAQRSYAEQDFGTVVFPGESRGFPMRLRQPWSGQSAALEVMTDRGPQHVALPATRER